VGTVTLNTTHTNAGTYSSDTWSFTGTANYNNIASTTITDKIEQVAASITVTPYDVPYDTNPHTASGTATGVGGANLNADLNLSGTTHTPAGTYGSDYWTFTDPTGNYKNVAATTITDKIEQATASIAVTPYHVTFDGNPHTAAGTATGVGGINLAGDLDLTHATHTLAGTYSSDYWTFTDPTGNYKNVAATTITDQIDQAPTVSTITVTPGTAQYSDQVVFKAEITPPSLGGQSPATGVEFYVGTECMGTVLLTPGTDASLGGPVLSASLTTTLLENTVSGCTPASVPAGQMKPGTTPHTVTAVFLGVNSNFSVGSPTTPLTIEQEDAQVTYTGLQYFTTSTTATTMSVAMTFTLQDATATGVGSPIYDAYAGDITKATVTLALTGIYPSGSFGGCSNLTPAPVAGQTGTATVSCTISGVTVPGSYNLTTTPGTGSYYTFTGDTTMPITTSNGGTGFITGGGFQTAAFLATAGTSGSGKYSTAGLLKPATNTKINFGFETKYNKSGSNLQGGANIIIRSACVNGVTGYTPVPGDDSLCVYQIKSNSLSSLSETLTPTPSSAAFTAKASIQDVTRPTALSVAGNLTLQLNMYDVADPGANADTLSIQVSDSTNGLWISTNWTGTKTVINTTTPVINGGNLQVH